MNKNLIMEFRKVIVKTEDGKKEFSIPEEKVKAALESTYKRLVDEITAEMEMYEMQQKMKNFVYNEEKLLAGDNEQLLYVAKSIIGCNIATSLNDLLPAFNNLIYGITSMEPLPLTELFSYLTKNKDAKNIEEVVGFNYRYDKSVKKFLFDILQSNFKFTFEALLYTFNSILEKCYHGKSKSYYNRTYKAIYNFLFKIEIYKDPKFIINYNSENCEYMLTTIIDIINDCDGDIEYGIKSLKEIYKDIYDTYGIEEINKIIFYIFENRNYLEECEIKSLVTIINFLATIDDKDCIIQNKNSFILKKEDLNNLYKNDWRSFLHCKSSFIEIHNEIAKILESNKEWKLRFLCNYYFINFLDEFEDYEDEVFILDLIKYVNIIGDMNYLMNFIEYYSNMDTDRLNELLYAIQSLKDFGIYIKDPGKGFSILRERYPEIFDEIVKAINNKENES